MEWEELLSFKPEDPPSVQLWLPLVEDLSELSHVSISALGSWLLVPGSDLMSGPDGRHDVPLSGEMLLFPAFAPGVLVGKLGGSTGSLDDSKCFVIGCRYVTQIPEKASGPLYLGFNRLKAAGTLKPVHLHVHVCGGRS
jgi:hypothetical protein